MDLIRTDILNHAVLIKNIINSYLIRDKKVYCINELNKIKIMLKTLFIVYALQNIYFDMVEHACVLSTNEQHTLEAHTQGFLPTGVPR